MNFKWMASIVHSPFKVRLCSSQGFGDPQVFPSLRLELRLRATSTHMTDNLLYDMDTATSPSFSDSDCSPVRCYSRNSKDEVFVKNTNSDSTTNQIYQHQQKPQVPEEMDLIIRLQEI